MFELLADHFILFGKEFRNYLNLFGSFSIYFYAIAIVTGMLTCALVAIPLFKRKGDNPEIISDLLIGIIPLCIVGARLWYVLFDIKSFHSFKDVIDIRSGGLAIYGGMLGGLFGVLIVCKIKKVKFLHMLDYGAVMIPLGQAIGRWGNFFNQEVFGKEITNTAFQFFPIGVEIDIYGGTKWFMALFFYESFLNLLLFAFLYTFFWKKTTKSNGYCVAIYLMGYGIIRGILENFRQSEYNLPLFGMEGVKGMVLISVIVFLIGFALLTILLKKDGYLNKKRNTDKSGG